MNRRYIILSIFLIVSLVIVISSLYIAGKNLKEAVVLEEQQAAFLETTAQPLTFSSRLSEPSPQTQVKDDNQPVVQEQEFNLDQIPDSYFDKSEPETEDVSSEDISLQEPRLKKYPSLKKLKELKTKGVIIY